MEQQTSLRPYVIRFAFVYVAFSIAAIVLVSLLQMSSNTGLAIGILMASAVAAGQKFITDNKRVFRTGEKLRMAFYSLLFALCLSALLLVGFLAWSGIAIEGFLQEMIGALSLRAITGIVALVFIGHFGALYLAYSFIVNAVHKGMVKRGEI